MSDLGDEITELLNKHSRENASDTPDFILAEYLLGCLEAFELAVSRRESWHGRPAPDAQPLCVILDGIHTRDVGPAPEDFHPEDCDCGECEPLDDGEPS